MGKRVLIVEDNRKNRLLEKDLLEKAGLEVFEATDGASGIVLAQKEKPDVIVMDVRLPDMRGTQAVRMLRQRPETCKIPVIYVTASVVGEAVDELRLFPNTMILTKPINTRTFAEEVSRCIDKGL
jgi:two-component system, cell cycle response regulator DivK